MNNVKISVIVPVYNTEKYLRRCLDSIVNQSFKDIEIIVVNDCSSDNSLNIIREYMEQDNRIILINKEKNEGLSAARNSGIKLAKGEYIQHIDSDDWIEQNYFKEVYQCAIENNADIVISDFYKDFDNGNIFYMEDQNIIITKNITLIENVCFLKGFPAIWNKLIRRKLYIENNIFHPLGISIGEDLYVILKLFFFSKKIIKYNHAFIHYIQTENSLIRKKEKNVIKVKDIYFVIKNLENFFRFKNIDLSINELKINHLSIWLLKSNYNLKDLDYLRILDEYIKLFSKVDLNNITSKKIRFFGKILKYLNKRIFFIILWHFNNIFEYLRGRYENK